MISLTRAIMPGGFSGAPAGCLVTLWERTFDGFDPLEYAQKTREVHRIYGALSGFDYAEPYLNADRQVAVKYLPC